MFQPIVVAVAAAIGRPIDPKDLALLDFSQIQPVLYGMIGLGAMRTYEKVKGATSKANQ